ncbi:MAG TPA: TetR/AcrR family transcriptional regulator [Bacillota bacterium]|mgnify:CR=1 FL=1|jgi:AcrR family transcriptional regulator|nr:TetR/AcrR family transcriptional regulator [Bacillota bacterium]HOB86783.1 TetR/AcrR family transcriptional regulator [Bacillota bacterium]HOP69495.1 TetR/AcrR family transcriptional regulator [Bacillota bacterium]HPT34421.1 TetR/AcrR family transcriptional regulator [Bacillota bacterium]HQD06221.1 TetR/AcrR family transcriptional regulator [Bacillota bacterium]
MDSQQKLNELYRAALKIFSRYGYKKATLEDIAAELGMTKGALYLYVKNKRDLYERTVAGALTRWQDRVEEAVKKETEPINKLTVLAFSAFQYLAEDEEMRNVLVQDPEIFPMFPREDPFFDINERSRNMLKAVLKEGIEKKVFREVDLDSVVWLLFSMYKMFIIEAYIIRGKESTLNLFNQALELVLHGLINK